MTSVLLHSDLTTERNRTLLGVLFAPLDTAKAIFLGKKNLSVSILFQSVCYICSVGISQKEAQYKMYPEEVGHLEGIILDFLFKSLAALITSVSILLVLKHSNDGSS